MDNKNYNHNVEDIVQNIILENRKTLHVTGVNDVLSFDDLIVILDTELGLLTIKGEKMKINKLNLDTKEISLDGYIWNIGYSSKEQNNNTSIIKKLFK